MCIQNNQNEVTLNKLKKYVTGTEKRNEIDFSNLSLVELMQEYDKIKRMNRPKFRGSSDVIFNLRSIENQIGNGYKILPSDVTDVFYNIFIEYLQNNGCKQSTIKIYCSKIRTVLKWSSKYGVKLSTSYDEFVVNVDKQDKIALTAAEIAHIAYFDIEKTFGGDKRSNSKYLRSDKRRTLERVRDQFVISACLGQRYSDIKEMLPENFNGSIFKIKQQKTGNVAIVDIDSLSIDKNMLYVILRKYDYRAPYPHNISNYNHYLHQLLEEIGGEFDEMVPVDRRVNGIVERVQVPKHKLVTSHCGRRTFVTFNVMRGIPEYKIRRASGHSDIRCFQSYICDAAC